MTPEWESAPRGRLWRAAALAGLVLAVAVGAVALRRAGPDTPGALRITAARPGGSEPADTDADASGWTRLPDSPLPTRSQPSTMWTGTEVLVLGGDGRRDGAAWDPARRRWRRLPDAPVPLRTSVAVWTGHGGVVVTPDATLHLDPEAAAWQRGPPPPRGLLRAVPPASNAVAIGDMVVVTGTSEPAAAAYDLRRRRWTALDVPRPRGFLHTPAVAAHGSTVLLFGDRGEGTIGWEVRSGGDRPRRLPPVPEDVLGDATRFVWLRAASSPDATYLLGRTVGAAAWQAVALEQSPAGPPRRWRALPEVPLLPRRPPTVAWIEEGLVVWSSDLGAGAVYRPGLQRWELLPPAPLPVSSGVGTATPDGLFLWVEGAAAVWTPE